MAAQYEAFGSYVTGICDEITKLSRFDENLGRRVRQFFLNLGASSCEAMAYYDRYDALYLEADAVLPQSVSDKKCWRGSASCAVMSWPANRANTATASTPTASASVKPRAAGDGGAAEQERRECLRRQLLRIQVRPLPKGARPFRRHGQRRGGRARKPAYAGSAAAPAGERIRPENACSLVNTTCCSAAADSLSPRWILRASICSTARRTSIKWAPRPL